MVVFSELDSLVQMARFATKKVPPYWDTNFTNHDPNDNPDTITPGKSDEDIDDTPEADGDENAVSKAQEGITTMDPGKRDIATLKRPTPGNPFHNGGTEMDKPMPSPTMPPLEDAETGFLYHKTRTVEVFLPNEIRAKLIQTFRRLD